MSTSSSYSNTVRVTEGDLLKSNSQALVNTVNTVGIMGKGIALSFKKRYPDMFHDYARRCDAGSVRLGEPYPYYADDHIIINFPTKGHWRAVSRLADIVAGLEYLVEHYKGWGITSIAVPPLGCGNGQLDWDVVGPTLYRHLSRLDIPVELYAPHGSLQKSGQLSLLESPANEGARLVEPEWIALVEILRRLESYRYHWPVGRVLFQKIAYFATQAGLPTGLEYKAASYGPYAELLKPALARLQNNALAVEVQNGRLLEVRVGPTFHDAAEAFSDQVQAYEDVIARTVDLVVRLDTTRAEVAASVHYVTKTLAEQLGRTPSSSEVLDGVERWKIRRRPPFQRPDILQAIVSLATRGWVEISPDESIFPYVEELIGA